MRILNCTIVNFGCLSGRSYSFKEGLNLLCADNGSGKSTLAVFIKAMFYGLPSSAKRSLTDNERRHYAPWGGGTYGGALEFEAAGRAYRIERFFGAREKEDRFTLYDLDTGKTSTDFTDAVGDELFGVDADGFERSLYISQRMPFKAPERNVSIYKKLGELLEVSDDLGDYEGANDRLEKAARTFRTIGEKGILWDLRRKIDGKKEEIREATDAAARCDTLTAQMKYLTEQRAALTEQAEEARANRAQAEKRRLMEEMGASYRRLNATLEGDMLALMPIEAFFSKRVPSEAAVAEAERLLQSYEELGVKHSMARMSDADGKRLSSLKAHMREIPSEEITEQLRERLTDYREAVDAAKKAEKKPCEEWDTLTLHFAKKLPSEEEVEAIHRATEAYDNAEADLLMNKEETKAQKKRLPPMAVLFAILAAIGLSFGIVCAILSQLPLVIANASCAVLFGVLCVIAVRRAPHTENIALKRLHTCHAKLSELIAPYGYTDKSPSVCARLLFKDLARYRILHAEDEAREAAHAEAQSKAQAARTAIRSQLAYYGIVDEPEAAMARFETDRAEFIRLRGVEDDLAEARAELEDAMNAASEGLNAFLAPYEQIKTLPFRAALTELREKLVLSRECLIRYEADRQSLSRFLAESGFDPNAPMPPYIGESETFAHKEKELAENLLTLEKRIAELHLQIDTQNEIALMLPLKAAELDGLTSELAVAEHTHELLGKTQKLLKEAKEDLSTKYLRDMEKHFSEYLAALDNKADGYSFDIDLALSTEREGERRSVEALSRGEQDLAAFCARLSLVDAIFSKETPFLVLDDPFVNLDDKHYARAFSLLERLAERFQIFYTTCSRARLQ